MKKIIFVMSLIIILLVSFLGITYSYEYDSNDNLVFKLIGPTDLYMNVNTDYYEYGIEVTYNNQDVSSKVVIDDSMINTRKLGQYKVKYSITYDDNLEYVYRNVIVIDNTSPEITLIGGDEVYILINSTYKENGYIVRDNYDSDLDDKVIVSGKVDTSKQGVYLINYTVSDNSGNKTVKTRKVIVKKPVITLDSGADNIIVPNNYNVTKYSNTIVNNSFNTSGVYYEGYVKEKSDTYKIKLKSRDNSLEYTYNMSSSKNNYYSGNLEFTTVSNGVYDLYVVGKKEERLLNKLNVFSKLVRAKVGSKLVTFMYDNDFVSIRVEDFEYRYDVVIDPGHGGSDIGASNGIVDEKNLNLKVSQYEKCRYESMGYRVYMVRNNDTYGEMLGNENLNKLDRRSLTIGYYGSVSKVTYSNHHNGSLNPNNHGYEIIVSNQATVDDLVIELSLYNKFKSFYAIKDKSVRLYSRDYDKGIIFDKLSGKINSNTNYYSVIRIPYELFNVKNIIYEPIYLSNLSDFNWYYSNNNWIKVSEMKIEEYVNYMGGTYIKDNSKCL